VLMSSKNIKAAISPTDYYYHELPGAIIKKAGWNNGGLCPFHTDTRARSFRINTISGAFKCFACGASGGDIVAFEQAKNGLSFPDALKKLAAGWGLSC